jgi:peroxiredoxin Q/BCP
VEAKLTRGVTASRWTFVIGLDGKILHKNTNVNAAKDSEAVLQIARAAAGEK